ARCCRAPSSERSPGPMRASAPLHPHKQIRRDGPHRALPSAPRKSYRRSTPSCRNLDRIVSSPATAGPAARYKKAADRLVGGGAEVGSGSMNHGHVNPHCHRIATIVTRVDTGGGCEGPTMVKYRG